MEFGALHVTNGDAVLLAVAARHQPPVEHGAREPDTDASDHRRRA